MYKFNQNTRIRAMGIKALVKNNNYIKSVTNHFAKLLYKYEGGDSCEKELAAYWK